MSIRLSSVVLFVAVLALSASAADLVLSVPATMAYGTPVQGQLFIFNAPTDALGTVNCVPKLDGRSLASFDVPAGASPSTPIKRTISSPALAVGQHTLSVACSKLLAGVINMWSASAEAAFNVESGAAACTDTDGGINYPVKGKCTSSDAIGAVNGEDYCADDGSTLTEFYCKSSACVKETHACPNGCANGACLSAQAKPVRVCKTIGGTETPLSDKTPFSVNLGSFKQVGDQLFALEDINAGKVKVTVSDKATGRIIVTGIIGANETVDLGNGKRLRLISVKLPPGLTPLAEFEIFSFSVSGGITYCLAVSSPITDYVYAKTPVPLTFTLTKAAEQATPTPTPSATPSEGGIISQDAFSILKLDGDIPCTDCCSDSDWSPNFQDTIFVPGYLMGHWKEPDHDCLDCAVMYDHCSLDGKGVYERYCPQQNQSWRQGTDGQCCLTNQLYVACPAGYSCFGGVGACRLSGPTPTPSASPSGTPQPTSAPPQPTSAPPEPTSAPPLPSPGPSEFACAYSLDGAAPVLIGNAVLGQPNSASLMVAPGSHKVSVSCVKGRDSGDTEPFVLDSGEIPFSVEFEMKPESVTLKLPQEGAAFCSESVPWLFSIIGSAPTYECVGVLNGVETPLVSDQSSLMFPPSSAISGTLTVKNAGVYEMYVKCRANVAGVTGAWFQSSNTHFTVFTPDKPVIWDPKSGETFCSYDVDTLASVCGGYPQYNCSYVIDGNSISAPKPFLPDVNYSSTLASLSVGAHSLYVECQGIKPKIPDCPQVNADGTPVCTTSESGCLEENRYEPKAGECKCQCRETKPDDPLGDMTAPKTPDTMALELLRQRVMPRTPDESANPTKAAVVTLVKISVRDGNFEIPGGMAKDVYVVAGISVPDDLATVKKGDIMRYVKESGLYAVVPPAKLAYSNGKNSDALSVQYLPKQEFMQEFTADMISVTASKGGFKWVDAILMSRKLYYTVSDAVRIPSGPGAVTLPPAGTLIAMEPTVGVISDVDYIYYATEISKATPTPEVPWVASDAVSFNIREPNKPVIYSPEEAEHYYNTFPLSFDVCGSYSQYLCRYNNTNAGNWSNTSVVSIGNAQPNTIINVPLGGLAVGAYQIFVGCAGTGTTTYVNSDEINYAYGTSSTPFINAPVITSPVNKVYYDQTTIDLTFGVSGSFAQYACSRRLNDGPFVSLGNVNNSQTTNFAGNLTGLQIGQTYEVLVNCTAGSLYAYASVPFRVEHWTGGGGGGGGGSGGSGGGTGGAGSGGTGGGTNIWGSGQVHLGAGAASPTPNATSTPIPTASPTTPRTRPSATMLSLDCPKVLSAPTAELSASLLASGKAACDNSLTTTVTINGSIPGKATFISCTSGLHRVVIDTAQGGDYTIQAYSPAYDVGAKCVFKNGMLVQDVPEMSLLLVVLAGAGAFYALSRRKK